MIFERFNGAFSRILVVAIQRNEFLVNVDASRELLEGVGCFIVDVWEPWL
jgi:hypothetical protein